MTSLATFWAWPLATALLPSRAGLRVLRRVSRAAALSAPEASAWRNAHAAGRTGLPESGQRPVDMAAWCTAWRLTQYLDRADLFVFLSRSPRWMRRHVDVRGEWPSPGPCLAVTGHWGAGLWALDLLRRSGHQPRFLARRPGEDDDRWHAAYVRLRAFAVARATGAPLVYTEGASHEIERSWVAGHTIVGLFDAPPGERSVARVPFGRSYIRLSRGLPRLACEHSIPVVEFSAAIDRRTGRRTITIGAAKVWHDAEALAHHWARELEALLQQDSAAWHLWPYAAELLEPPDDQRAASST